MTSISLRCPEPEMAVHDDAAPYRRRYRGPFDAQGQVRVT